MTELWITTIFWTLYALGAIAVWIFFIGVIVYAVKKG